jgi:Sulfatase
VVPVKKEYFEVVNMYEWEGEAGKPARKVGEFSWDYLANFDVRQADSAIEYIKTHANDSKPFFMDVNFMKMHNPTNPAPKFAGKTRLGRYSDSVLEMDDNVGRIMDAIRQLAPNTIVIFTADNGAWQDAYPDAGTHPFRGEKGSAFEAGWRVPGIMWWPNHIPQGVVLDEMMSHIDVWSTTSAMVGVTPPPHGEWKGNDGKPIYFDSIDNSAYILGKAKHSARDSWIYIDGENFMGARADMGGDPTNDEIHIAWKYLYTAKDTWLGPTQNLGSIGSLYNLTMDPLEKYDMIFNGAMAARLAKSSPGQYAGEDNGWCLALIYPVILEFDQSIIKYPSIKRFVGGASNDLIPNLQHPENPVPLVADPTKIKVKGGAN